MIEVLFMTKTNSPTAILNRHIMLVLLAKDWRLYRVPVMGLLVVSAGCYLLGTAWALNKWSDRFLGPQDIFFEVSLIAANLTALLASVFGGMAIAGERRERTADFLAVLPVTRTQILLSKWLVSFLVVSAFGAFNGIIAALSVLIPNRHYFWTYPGIEEAMPEWTSVIAVWVGCGLCFFGIAWLLSTRIRSAPISACVSIAVTIGMVPLLDIAVHPFIGNSPLWGRHGFREMQFVAAAILVVIGLSSLARGTFHYLRRIDP